MREWRHSRMQITGGLGSTDPLKWNEELYLTITFGSGPNNNLKHTRHPPFQLRGAESITQIQQRLLTLDSNVKQRPVISQWSYNHSWCKISTSFITASYDHTQTTPMHQTHPYNVQSPVTPIQRPITCCTRRPASRAWSWPVSRSASAQAGTAGGGWSSVRGEVSRRSEVRQNGSGRPARAPCARRTGQGDSG